MAPAYQLQLGQNTEDKPHIGCASGSLQQSAHPGLGADDTLVQNSRLDLFFVSARLDLVRQVLQLFLKNISVQFIAILHCRTKRLQSSHHMPHPLLMGG